MSETEPTNAVLAEAEHLVELLHAPAAPKTPMATIVAGWVDDLIRNSPVAGTVEGWNHLTASLPELARRLEEAR